MLLGSMSLQARKQVWMNSRRFLPFTRSNNLQASDTAKAAPIPGDILLRNSRLSPIICCLFSLCLCTITHAQSAYKLSLKEAVILAQKNSSLLLSAEARSLQAEAKLHNAKSPVNPSLTLAQPAGQNTGGLDEDVLISQTFELGEKRRQHINAVRGERDSVKHKQAQTKLNVVFAMQSAYFDGLRADANLQLSEAALKNAERFSKAADDQFKAGQVARSNVLRSSIELVRAQQTYNSAITDRDNSLSTIRSLAGLPDNSALELTDILDFHFKTYQLADLQKLAALTRPDIKAEKSLLGAKEADLHASKVQSIPDLLIEARHSTLDPTVGGSSIRIGLVIPLFDWGKSRADVALARAALLDQQAIAKEALRTSRLEVETAFRNLMQTQEVVTGFRTGRLDRAKQLLEMAEIGYQNGANSFLELIDAQQIYRLEQTDYIRALVDHNLAMAKLELAVGSLLP